MKNQVFLTLADGTVWKGYGELDQPVEGEVVFTTSAGGYPQVLTDPSYCGQIVVFAFPPTGIYGVDTERLEGQRPWAAAALCSIVDETRDGRFQHLSTWMKEKETPLLGGFDTRQLILTLRQHGSVMGRLDTKPVAPVTTKEPNYIDLVSCKEKEILGDGNVTVAVVDYGVKANLVRSLLARNCRIIKFPHTVTAEEILCSGVKGVILAGGPGDPNDLPEGIALVKGLMGKIPYMGIGLGCELLALACGASIYKMNFSHRGSKPVIDTVTGRGFQSSQNHQYNIEEESLEGTGLMVSFRNLADKTIAGVRHTEVAACGVFYDPDASPGPEESVFILEKFIERIRSGEVA